MLLFWKWRDLYDGKFEITRGLIIMILVFLPWHIAMWLKDGLTFINEYLFTHILNRAGGDPDKSLGTFEYYTSQLGHGMEQMFTAPADFKISTDHFCISVKIFLSFSPQVT